MKVTLIYPGTGVLGFNQVFSISGESRWINHGLALIGANLKRAGHEVDLIDMRILSGWDNLRAELIAKKPDVVGVGTSYLDFNAAVGAVRIAKNLGAITVMGGLLPSVFPEKAAEVKEADFIIVGEGEISMVELLDTKRSIAGRIITGKVPDLDELPFADRTLFQYDREYTMGFAPGQPLPSITMIAGRGCPYNCKYCQPAERKTFKGRYRLRPPENVCNELAYLKEAYQFNSITFWDDTFALRPDWVFKFCDMYGKYDFKATFSANCRVDIICNNEPMIARLAKVGLTWLVVGFETGTQRMLDFIGKGTRLEQNFKAAEICRKYGINIFGTFMIGLPSETNQEAKATIEMIKVLDCEHYMLFYFNPIPGTYLGNLCIENKLLLKDDPFAIERTDEFSPKIKGIDYEFLNNLRKEVT